ncbi:hypothetical protein QLX08_001994 [Tetragonisca angustula]|uniref:Uncharacterized protein n=1 Tax=Tetragonisca angustula TaxID=166442 RepID=A0AAW1AFC9_9HYME
MKSNDTFNDIYRKVAWRTEEKLQVALRDQLSELRQSLEKTRVPVENEWNECEEVCSVRPGFSDRWLDGLVQTPKQTLSWLPSTDPPSNHTNRVITIIPATAQANIDCH